jgi:hypothetical protein
MTSCTAAGLGQRSTSSRSHRDAQIRDRQRVVASIEIAGRQRDCGALLRPTRGIVIFIDRQGTGTSQNTASTRR